MKIVNYVKQNYILAAILLLAAFLRLYHLDFQSIWLDEMHTMVETDPNVSYSEFYDVIAFREGMGHLYFILVRLMHNLLGYSTYTARLFSVIIGTLSIYSVYLLGKTLYSKNAGLTGALLLTVNFFHISYSQEARPYILWVLLTILSFYRLVLFIRKQSLKNAVFFALFTGLTVHAHAVGLVTVFSEFLLLLFMLFITQKQDKLRFLKFSFIAGIATLIVMLPTYKLFVKVSGYHSGWLTLPGPDGFTNIFMQFLGNTEMLYFIFNLLFIFYFINLFRQKETGLAALNVKNDRLIFSTLLFFSWVFLSILIPILKSYLDEPMILARYFIHILPAFILILAIAIQLIKNNIARTLLLTTIVLFSLTDIFAVKNYYNTVTKSQFKQVTNTITKRNKSNDKCVSSFGWLMGYFLNKDKITPVTEMGLAAYIQGLRNKSIPMESFWYIDGNSRPYALSPEDEQFLQENFTLKENIEKYDAWTRHYISKAEPQQNENIMLKDFLPATLDTNGNLMFFENSTVKSPIVNLQKGNYKLIIKGNSMPAKPIRGENAHLIIKLNQKEIGDVNLSENTSDNELIIPFESEKNRKTRFIFIYDNDVFADNADRNAIIYSIKVIKQ